MNSFSFYPPTTESDAAAKLQLDIKEIKKLKKNGFLDYKGKLICNLSLQEYLNGGKGYHEVLSIHLQNKIAKKIDMHHKEIQLFKKVSEQLIKLYSKDYITVSYKSIQMMKPTNIYAVKMVGWSSKADKHAQNVLQIIGSEIIEKLSYTYYSNNLQDERIVKFFEGYIKQIKEFGFVSKIDLLIDKKITERQAVQEDILTLYDSLSEKDRHNIDELSKLKKDIANCEYSLILVPDATYSRKKLDEYQSKLVELKNTANFEEHENYSEKLYISYEIQLWQGFKEQLNTKNPYGYQDFVTEFNETKNVVKNKLLSKRDIVDVVNQTKKLFNLKPIKSFESACNELNNSLGWHYDL